MTGGDVLVGFVLGPMDEIELEGPVALAIVQLQPPYACTYADGRHEHYISVTDCQAHTVCFEYVGPCARIDEHPDCGHRHD